jgi:methionyl-tRNA formyltransferase
VARRYLALRRGSETSGESAQSLVAWAVARGLSVVGTRRLDPDPVRRLAPDLIVLVGADIVPASALAVPPLGTINAHFAMLPRYRGMNVTEWSVYHGDPVGVSVHLVDPGIDTGPIVVQEKIAIERGETFATLRDRHRELAASLLVDAAIGLRDGTAEPVAQKPEDGQQFYVMHPALRRVAEARLQARAAGGEADAGARSGAPSLVAATSTNPSATCASHQRR